MIIPEYTEFFRDDNITDFVNQHAGRLALLAGGKIKIAEVGCNSGEETWSLAAMLMQHAVSNQYDFDIDAYDRNREALKRVYGPYPAISVHDDRFAEVRRRNGYPDECLPYLLQWVHAGAGGLETVVRPASSLMRRVNFQSRDVAEEPLPPRQYQAVVINNVLSGYQSQQRERVFINSLNGIDADGVVVLESDALHHTPEYRDWRRSLPSHFGLEPVSHPSVQPPTLLRRMYR